MKHYEAHALIDAPPEIVWEVLTEAQGWQEWAGSRVEGRIAPGARLEVTSDLNPGRAFAVRVTRFDPPARMEWTGGMPFGLFRGVRTFSLAPEGGGRTAFAMREAFSGPLLPLIWRTMPDFQPAFDRFGAALAARAESRRAGSSQPA